MQLQILRMKQVGDPDNDTDSASVCVEEGEE